MDKQGTFSDTLGLLAPAGGELVVKVESVPNSVSVNGASPTLVGIETALNGSVTVTVSLPVGQDTVVFSFK